MSIGQTTRIDEAGAEPIRRGRPRDPAKDEAILRAAIDLFMDKGFEATSLDAVAERAGVSKATIYARFPDKDELFKTAVLHKCDAMLDPNAFQLSPDDGVREGLTNIARQFLGLILSDDAMGLHRIMSVESQRANRISELFFATAVEGGKQKVADFFRREIARGRLTLDAEDAERAAWAFLGGVKGEPHMRAMLNLPPMEPERQERQIAFCVESFCRAYGA